MEQLEQTGRVFFLLSDHKILATLEKTSIISELMLGSIENIPEQIEHVTHVCKPADLHHKNEKQNLKTGLPP